jgi:hypothetical protein
MSTILNSLYTGMICTTFDWDWPAGSGDFFKISVYFYSITIISPWAGALSFIWTFFCDYLPFEEDLTLYLNKLEFLLPKDNFITFDWILKISVLILPFCYYLPLERGVPLHWNKFESPLPNDLCQVWLKLAKWLCRSRKCKTLRQTDGRTTGDQKSSLKLSAQVK